MSDESETAAASNESQRDEMVLEPDVRQHVAVKFEDVSEAAFRIRGRVDRTPCIVSSIYRTCTV